MVFPQTQLMEACFLPDLNRGFWREYLMIFHHRIQGNGFPLIIVHGLFGSMDNWRSLAAKLARKFQVITIDLPNHGHSPSKEIFTYPALAQDLVHFMEQQGISKAALLGHSLGGKVVMQCALAFPQRVSHLVVADIAPRAYPPEHTFIFNALRELDVSAYESRQALDKALASSLPNARLRQFLLMNLEKAEKGYRWRINLENLYQNYSAICAGIEGKNSYSSPSLFIKGEQSNYIQKRDEKEIKHWFTKAEIVSISAAGHWLHVDAPEIFINLVSKFLNKRGE